MDWKNDDVVTTTFGTLKQAQAESYEEAMSVVDSIIDQMIDGGFDYATLEELRQRIR